MIKTVTVTNYLGQSLVIDLKFPEKSGLLIQGITGLGPSKATINSTEMAALDGALFNSSRVNARNIVLTMHLMSSPTVEDVRQRLYKYFPIKKRLKLTFETDNRLCETYGYVESNEPTFFTNQEQSQVSIICPDPYLYSSGPGGTAVTVFAGIEPTFEFPFFNKELHAPTMSMGDIIKNQEQTVYYDGDAEVGVMIYIHAVGEAGTLSIYNSGTRELMRIDARLLEELTGRGISDGDDIIISTIKGNKFIELLRDGTYINILNSLGRDSAWFQLVKGDNVFAFNTDHGNSNLQFRIENQKLYEGV